MKTNGGDRRDLLTIGAASAADIKPAVVFDMGGKFDKASTRACTTVWSVSSETGSIQEFEVTNETQREQAIRRMRSRPGPGPRRRLRRSARDRKGRQEFPDTPSPSSTWSSTYRTCSPWSSRSRGLFLVGVLAQRRRYRHRRLRRRHGHPADPPLRLRLRPGGEARQGRRDRDPEHDRHHAVGLERPDQGCRAREEPVRPGADVIYAAAGGTGIGVYQAAKDSTPSASTPTRTSCIRTMLTSMLKQVDNAAYNAFMSAKNGAWKPGIEILGLAEEGVGWALDEHNQGLISAPTKALVTNAQKGILDGSIVVHDYMADNSCPVK